MRDIPNVDYFQIMCQKKLKLLNFKDKIKLKLMDQFHDFRHLNLTQIHSKFSIPSKIGYCVVCLKNELVECKPESPLGTIFEKL